MRAAGLYGAMALAIGLVGMLQSWSLALAILNLSIISAIMALGVNIQWGYAGLFNVGIMGFAALGGVAAVLVSTPPVGEAWAAGGGRMLIAGLAMVASIGAVIFARARLTGRLRLWTTIALIAAAYALVRMIYDPAVLAIEAINPAAAGNLGGLGLPILLAWAVGGLFAAGAAWVVGKIALGLRSDYLAIATLGISEIIIAVMKNEDWLTRGVKNVTGLPRPVPYEVNLQQTEWFLSLAARLGQAPVAFSGVFVKLCYTGLFTVVLLGIYVLSEKALNSPWGRMMRAIRDNRDAAEAMGKNVTKRHLQTFILGSAVVGIAGAMMTTQDGLFTPGTYNPLRYTFLIWVMVIVGGSGNNKGAILGGFVVWFLWIEVESWGPDLMAFLTSSLSDGALKAHLLDAGPHLRLFLMGLMLLVVMRFAPRGLIPEQQKSR